jgi:NADH-quinone oxidoreductase subunit N
VTDLLPLVNENLSSAGFFRPELALTFGTMALFLVDLAWKNHPGRAGRLAASALLVLAVAAGLLAAQPGQARSLFNGMIANDGFATFFKWLFLAAGALTVMIAAPGKEFPPARLGEFYALLMAIVLGMFLMAST